MGRIKRISIDAPALLDLIKIIDDEAIPENARFIDIKLKRDTAEPVLELIVSDNSFDHIDEKKQDVPEIELLIHPDKRAVFKEVMKHAGSIVSTAEREIYLNNRESAEGGRY